MAVDLNKPRTNYEAAEWWAAHICETEPANLGRDVNSIEISRDVIYSFGHHYPMGRIVRYLDTGEVYRVIVTSAYYPVRGFANTPGDQGNVERAANSWVHRLNSTRPKSRQVRVEKLPLTEHGMEHGVRVLPRADDPEIERSYITVIPTFHATDPGPEPVRTTEGCIAGTHEVYSYEDEDYMSSNLELQADDQAYTVTGWGVPKPGDFLIRQSHGSIYARRASNAILYHGLNQFSGPWGQPFDERWSEFQAEHEGADIHYAQCPHCAEFDAVHARWRVQMHGQWGMGRYKGFATYAEYVRRYGSVDGWREARRRDIIGVRRTNALREAWIERNYIPLHAVSRDADNLPILLNGKYAMRKDAEAHFKRQRDAERAEQRVRREHEARMRREAAMRRTTERWQRKRQQRHERSFFGIAERAARVLAETRANMHDATTNELES